jgi:UDP-glucose 4-epimerase
MKRVLITGITGFLGAHIADNLIESEYEITGLIRIKSNLWRCAKFQNRVNWVYIDDKGDFEFTNDIFDIVIHCAWIGVEANDRNNWLEQTENLSFLIKLLSSIKSKQVAKFIFMGSQAEYGFFNWKVKESDILNPTCAYGSVKCASNMLVKTFCEQNNINWISLRLFPLFGEMESDNWLIPSLVKNILTSNEMNLTYGEQIYSYLYVRDFSRIIQKIITKDIAAGIYNVSSNQPIQIKKLVESIRDILNKDFQLNFGNLNYRENQSMHIEGDISLLESQIGEIKFTDFDKSLRNTIEYYIDKK